MTLVCEDSNSKLFELVTVAGVDDEDIVGISFLQIWKLRSEVEFVNAVTAGGSQGPARVGF